MKRRSSASSVLYIGSTDASHSLASVRNVTRDRVGALLSLPPPCVERGMSDALSRDIRPRASYRRTFFLVPSGAISISRQRIAHPFPRFSRHRFRTVVSFEPSERLPFLSLALRGLARIDCSGSRERITLVRHFFQERAHGAGVKAHVLADLDVGKPFGRGVPRARVCS